MIFSVFILFSEITQVFLECILCRKAGVGQVSFLPDPRPQSAIIEYFMLPSIMNGTILKRWLRNKRGALLIFEIANDIINVPERSRAYEHREQHKAIKTTA